MIDFWMKTIISHLSGLSLLGNLSLPAHRDARVLQGCSFVLLWKSLEVQEDLVNPENQEPLDVLGDRAEISLEHRLHLSGLSLLGSLVVQADHRHR